MASANRRHENQHTVFGWDSVAVFVGGCCAQSPQPPGSAVESDCFRAFTVDSCACGLGKLMSVDKDLKILLLLLMMTGAAAAETKSANSSSSAWFDETLGCFCSAGVDKGMFWNSRDKLRSMGHGGCTVWWTGPTGWIGCATGVDAMKDGSGGLGMRRRTSIVRCWMSKLV